MNKSFKLIFAVLISSLGIYLAFSGENWTEVQSQLINVNLKGILLATFLLVFSCIVRAYRWKLLIDPIEEIPIRTVFSSTMIGYFGNGILAFRLGELLKAYSLSKRNQINVSEAFGTVILERILDLLMVAIVLLVIIPWFPFDNEILRVGSLSFGGIILLTVMFSFLLVKKKWLQKIELNWRSGNNLVVQIHKILKEVIKGLYVIKKNQKKNRVLLLSIFIWLIYIVITIITLNSCDIGMGFYDTLILFILGSLSLGIPALPGSAGTYDAGIKYGLVVIFSIESSKALTYAIVSHAVSYFPLVIIGAFYFFYGTVKLKDINSEH